MPRKRINFKYQKERCLLSDVLPYETPVSFTNRHFYEFVLSNKIEVNGLNIIWKKSEPALDELIHILLSLPKNPARLTTVIKSIADKNIEFQQYNCGGAPIPKPARSPKPERFLVPFGYKINHKKSEFRELTIPHPRSQLNVVEFYDRCKETILYYTSLSPFSIRHPAKISKYKFLKDRLHYERLAENGPSVEEHNKEYESLKSFFVYKDVSNIYKFYESFRYHRCEKKYNNLIKLDISKCFDSIYTHSITWAILGKGALKEHLSESNGTFAGDFDKLMQFMHYGETNGIIIGPEFSRIFAEIVLQRVDKLLEVCLSKKNPSLQHKVDYEIFRYVDDYFVFYNDDNTKEIIVEELQHTLKDYKLALNAAKAITYEKPIITEITIAKNQITRLFSDKLIYKLEEIEEVEGVDEEPRFRGSIYINSNRLITDFKTIIKTSGVEYKDLLNYSLAIVERKCEKILLNYSTAEDEDQSRMQLVTALKSILEFVFFIYSVSPKVNTTIRLCRILRVICSFLVPFEKEYIRIIHKDIFDEITFILKKNKQSEHTQVETLYLLIALTELGKSFWLEEAALEEYLGFDGPKEGEEKTSKSLNYFSITVALFYMKDKIRYNGLRQKIEGIAVDKYRAKKDTRYKDAELVMLFLDLMSCSYISRSTKEAILLIYKIDDVGLQDEIIDFQNANGVRQLWFTSWNNFNFGKELDAKQSQEVY